MGLASGVTRTQALVEVFFSQRRKLPVLTAPLMLQLTVVESPWVKVAGVAGALISIVRLPKTLKWRVTVVELPTLSYSVTVMVCAPAPALATWVAVAGLPSRV